MSRPLRNQLLTAMSSSSTYRGGRNQRRRSFSERSYNNGGRGHYVSGDSHFRSVRDSNLSFRQGNSSNQQPPHYQQFSQPPPYNRNPRFPQPPSLFVQNQSQRPRPPKPSDYRNWECAKAAPPPDSDRFSVLSYNILADYLASGHRNKLYYHIPRHILDWQWRKKSILFELRLWSADIMCFQEVDRFEELEDELNVRGYNGIRKMRTGNAIDGCAMFWRTSRFKLVFEESIEFNKLGLRDNVAQICVLEQLSQNHAENKATLLTSSAPCNRVVVCNIHVLYNPRRGEIKLGQLRTLLDRAHAVSKIWDNAPVVLCGDFNCTPKSPLYNFISEQKLDLSGVDRDKVSGQASAEIRAPKYNPNPRTQTADGSIQSPSVVGSSSVDSLFTVMQKHDNDGNAEMFPSQSTETVLHGSDKACGNMQCGNDKSELINEETIETEQTVGDEFKAEEGSAFPISIDKTKPSLSCLQNEGRFSTKAGQINDENHEISPSRSSNPENRSELTEMGEEEKANVPAYSSHGSTSEQSDSNFNKEIEITNADDSTCPIVSNDHSTLAGCNPEMTTASNSEISSTTGSFLTCSHDAIEVSVGSFGKISSQSSINDKDGNYSTTYENEVSSSSSNIDILVADKLENLSLSNLYETTVEGGSIDEDDNTFLSALHNKDDAYPPDLDPSSKEFGDEKIDDLSPALDPEAVEVEKTAYDPSLWTPMEIATATGNGDCTILEHPLQLRSTYAEVEDCSGTRDSNGEPLVTSYNRCFQGTVDYIWRSEGLQTVRVLAPIPKHAMQWTSGFPTKKWGSDHIALVSEVAFVKP